MKPGIEPYAPGSLSDSAAPYVGSGLGHVNPNFSENIRIEAHAPSSLSDTAASHLGGGLALVDQNDFSEDIKEDVNIPQPFLGVVNIEDKEEIYDDDAVDESGAAVDNPNKNDTRRLFQERVTEYNWNVLLPYEDQPNRLEQDGPTPLLYPDHFYQTEGGVVLIY